MSNLNEHPLIALGRMVEDSKQNDPELHELVKAAQAGEIAEVKRLLAKGLSPNQLPPGGTDTAVWAALYARKPDVMRVLAGSGADLNDGTSNTPLEIAAEWGHVELIRALIDGGADVNRATMSGNTPLRAALAKGHTDAVLALLSGGADPTFAPPCARFPGTTPLEYAAVNLGPPVLDAMLSALGDRRVEHLDAMLLCAAAARGDLAEVKRRLAAGAEINAPDRTGQTPIFAAAVGGHASIVKALLAAGASTRGAPARKPLTGAAQCGKLAVVKLLVEAGAEDVAEALLYAKNCRHKKIVEYLLAVTPTGRTSPKAVDRPTGVATFDVNDSCLLVRAPVQQASAELQTLLGARTLKPNVLGKKIKLAARCYAVFRIVDQPWSIVWRLCSDIADTFHQPSAAAALSRSLATRVILVNSGDTGGVYQYHAYDQGELVEVFDVGSASTLDLASLKNVARARQMTFASSLRKPDLKQIRNPLDFIGDYIKAENALVPFGFEALGNPGETVELTLEELGADDVERLDYIAV